MPEQGNGNDNRFSLMDAYHFGYQVALSACKIEPDIWQTLAFLHLLEPIAEGNHIIQNAPADSRPALLRFLKKIEENPDGKYNPTILREYLEEDEKDFAQSVQRDQELAKRLITELHSG